jgi:DNA processing protein
VLFIKGSFEGIFNANSKLDCVSIVGTRQCTRKGAELTQAIAKELAAAGVTVVSGMARGIDSNAHTGALDGGGKTIAVLGCGADVIYPPESGDIYYRTIESGAVVSELPAGTKPYLTNFPARNRIIAGLSRGTLIVESDIKGGTVITASMATAMGRDVFAVPGAPYMRTAALPDMLIEKGAYPVKNAADILKFYGCAGEESGTLPNFEQIQLDFLQRQIYNLLLQGDASVENMASCIQYPQSEINSALTMMELGGLIKRLPGGKYGI